MTQSGDCLCHLPLGLLQCAAFWDCLPVGHRGCRRRRTGPHASPRWHRPHCLPPWPGRSCTGYPYDPVKVLVYVYMAIRIWHQCTLVARWLPIEAVHLTSFGRQTNHQCMAIVNIHHIAFTRATAVLTANFYCYHERYHVGARPLYQAPSSEAAAWRVAASTPVVAKVVGRQAFDVVGFKLWNELSLSNRQLSSLPAFKRALKPYVVRDRYKNLWLQWLPSRLEHGSLCGLFVGYSWIFG